MNSKPALSYHSYLHLEKILTAQEPLAGQHGSAAHDETLFIIVHQVFELWFKQILVEIDSIRGIFSGSMVDERQMGVCVSRLHRIASIQTLMLQQFKVLETMTPLDFLDFRGYLERASGFQSYQFRILENKLGLLPEKRGLYGNVSYHSDFAGDILAAVKSSESEPSLFAVIEGWLERTPFLQFANFDFTAEFRRAAETMIEEDRKKALSMVQGEAEKSRQEAAIQDTRGFFESLLNPNEHKKLVEQGLRRLSHKATIAALFISLYRDEPILQLPFRFLDALVDLDEQFALWRFQHAMMVLRMLGKKVGTGKSSGYDYLMSTVEKNRVFSDLAHLSTALIPRSLLPELPRAVSDRLSFSFQVEAGNA